VVETSIDLQTLEGVSTGIVCGAALKAVETIFDSNRN
jgi:hypothetical protein